MNTKEVLAIALLPCVGIAILVVQLVAEGLGFRPLAQPPATTVSEAAALGAAARAVELLASGQDPNRPGRVGPGILDGDPGEVTPVDAAIFGRRAGMVGLLQLHGATLDPVRGACLARAVALADALPYFGVIDATVDEDAIVGPEEALRRCGEGAGEGAVKGTGTRE